MYLHEVRAAAVVGYQTTITYPLDEMMGKGRQQHALLL
jgi:hypothetical protein